MVTFNFDKLYLNFKNIGILQKFAKCLTFQLNAKRPIIGFMRVAYFIRMAQFVSVCAFESNCTYCEKKEATFKYSIANRITQRKREKEGE